MLSHCSSLTPARMRREGVSSIFFRAFRYDIADALLHALNTHILRLRPSLMAIAHALLRCTESSVTVTCSSVDVYGGVCLFIVGTFRVKSSARESHYVITYMVRATLFKQIIT